MKGQICNPPEALAAPGPCTPYLPFKIASCSCVEQFVFPAPGKQTILDVLKEAVSSSLHTAVECNLQYVVAVCKIRDLHQRRKGSFLFTDRGEDTTLVDMVQYEHLWYAGLHEIMPQRSLRSQYGRHFSRLHYECPKRPMRRQSCSAAHTRLWPALWADQSSLHLSRNRNITVLQRAEVL